MEPGRMRHRIRIQRLSRARNEFGEPEERWEDAAAVWASIQPVSGREFLAAMKAQAEVTHRVSIRYNPAVKASMRVLVGDRVLDILHILDAWEQHREMTLLCRERI